MTKIKILLTAKIVAIVLLFLLALLWRNSFSPAFMFLLILFASFLAIGTIADYIVYTILEEHTKNK